MNLDRYAVIGNPIEHSKSPWIHARFAEQTGEPVEYGRILGTIGAFAQDVRTFIEAGSLGSGKTTYTETGVMWQTIIHGLFILSAIGIALVDWLSQLTEQKHHHAAR